MHNKHQLPAPALPSSRSGLLFVVLLSLAMASNAIADQPQTGGSVKNDCSDRSAEAGDQSGMGLVVGDRLKIVFYSRVGSGSDGANTGVSDLASLVEHPEMTGEYIVQLDGTIFLPLIGEVNAAGQGEESLVTILERKSKAIFHGPTNVSVHLVEREPVYVTGDILQPGAFKYDPGMVILNAVGLAGLHAAGPDLGARLDVVRESQRLRESQIELADLLARRDVLVANRNGRTPTPSQDLSHLVGASDAAARIAAAKGVSDLEADKLASEQKILDEKLAMLTQERSSLTQGLSEAEASMKDHAARFNAVAQLHQKGKVTDATYDLSRDQVDNSRGRWRDIRGALTGVEHRILEVAEQQSNSIADTTIARERAINQLEVQIQQAEALQSTLGPTLVSNGRGATPTQPHYKIVRHSMNGLHEFDADKFAAVQPGDIVEVIRPSPELGPADMEATGTVGRRNSSALPAAPNQPSSAPPASNPASDGRPPAKALNPPEGASAAAVPVETPPPPAIASALPTAPNPPSSAPPASNPASDGRPPATTATVLASSETCKRDRDRLARLRGNPSVEEVQHFENELSCEILRPQFLRLKESLGLAVAAPSAPSDAEIAALPAAPNQPSSSAPPTSNADMEATRTVGRGKSQ